MTSQNWYRLLRNGACDARAPSDLVINISSKGKIEFFGMKCGNSLPQLLIVRYLRWILEIQMSTYLFTYLNYINVAYM